MSDISDDTCCICTEIIEEQQFKTVCNHSFHVYCLFEWTDRFQNIIDINCPLCRTCLLNDSTRFMFENRETAKYNNEEKEDGEWIFERFTTNIINDIGNEYINDYTTYNYYDYNDNDNDNYNNNYNDNYNNNNNHENENENENNESNNTTNFNTNVSEIQITPYSNVVIPPIINSISFTDELENLLMFPNTNVTPDSISIFSLPTIITHECNSISSIINEMVNKINELIETYGINEINAVVFSQEHGYSEIRTTTLNILYVYKLERRFIR